MLKKICIIGIILFFTLFLGSNVKAVSLKTDEYLSRGSRGSDVFTLQMMLNKTLKCNIEVDGIFGKNTNEKVLEFQEKYGLEQDGIIGPKTRKKLNEIYEKKIIKNKILVVAEDLNIRQDAGSKNELVSGNSKAQRYKIYTVKDIKKVGKNPWYKIEYEKGKYGYICGASEYVKTTFVLVDISDQHLIYFENGKETLYTPIVTGNESAKMDTPTVTTKFLQLKPTKDLKGKDFDGSDYECSVKNWMAFKKGYGLHDASWRSSFGGEIYKTNGSHGCVNLPSKYAKALYEKITLDTYIKVRK